MTSGNIGLEHIFSQSIKDPSLLKFLFEGLFFFPNSTRAQIYNKINLVIASNEFNVSELLKGEEFDTFLIQSIVKSYSSSRCPEKLITNLLSSSFKNPDEMLKAAFYFSDEDVQSNREIFVSGLNILATMTSTSILSDLNSQVRYSYYVDQLTDLSASDRNQISRLYLFSVVKRIRAYPKNRVKYFAWENIRQFFDYTLNTIFHFSSSDGIYVYLNAKKQIPDIILVSEIFSWLESVIKSNILDIHCFTHDLDEIKDSTETNEALKLQFRIFSDLRFYIISIMSNGKVDKENFFRSIDQLSIDLKQLAKQNFKGDEDDRIGFFALLRRKQFKLQISECLLNLSQSIELRFGKEESPKDLDALSTFFAKEILSEILGNAKDEKPAIEIPKQTKQKVLRFSKSLDASSSVVKNTILDEKSEHEL
jgi:hypothetical protein